MVLMQVLVAALAAAGLGAPEAVEMECAGVAQVRPPALFLTITWVAPPDAFANLFTCPRSFFKIYIPWPPS